MHSGFLGTQFFFSFAAAHCVDKRQFYRIVNFSSLDTFLFELKGQSIDSESVNKRLREYFCPVNSECIKQMLVMSVM